MIILFKIIPRLIATVLYITQILIMLIMAIVIWEWDGCGMDHKANDVLNTIWGTNK